MSTPRTDGIEGEAYQYKWDCKVVHSEFARQLETELAEMRQAMSRVATNLGNGSFATMDASHEWMTKEVPEEVRLYCERLRRELAAEREKVAKLKDIIRRASTTFCKEGTDGEIAAEMLRIIGESKYAIN